MKMYLLTNKLIIKKFFNTLYNEFPDHGDYLNDYD